MKTPYKNIYTVLELNRLIVLTVVIGGVMTCIISLFLVYKVHQQSMNKAFAIRTDGDIIPLQLIDRQENIEVEVLAHLELFHTYFYHIDAANYEKQLEKALWLGDISVDELYRQKKSEGVYNRLLQYSLMQRVLNIESKVDLQQEPYRFQTTIIFEINRGSITDKYKLNTTGSILKVDRNFPKNTHGLLITDFYEKSLRKIINDDL